MSISPTSLIIEISLLLVIQMHSDKISREAKAHGLFQLTEQTLNVLGEIMIVVRVTDEIPAKNDGCER